MLEFLATGLGYILAIIWMGLGMHAARGITLGWKFAIWLGPLGYFIFPQDDF